MTPLLPDPPRHPPASHPREHARPAPADAALGRWRASRATMVSALLALLALLALPVMSAMPAARVTPASPPVPSAPTAAADAVEVVRLGVLSVTDEGETQRSWQPLVDALAARVPARRWQLLTLDQPALERALAERRLDFVVSNPGLYVVLEARHGVTRIATQSSDEREDPGHAVGSAVVARPGPDAPRDWDDLRGRRVAAVSGQAFGGYQVAAVEWLRHGIDAEDGDLQMVFTGSPMSRVADAVLDGRADAGVLRTCLLERWQREGRIAPGALVVVAPRPAGTLPCQASSPLYPGWAFAASAQTSPALARAVVLALLAMPPDAGGARWSVPADYQRVHEVLRTLQVGPYDFLRTTRWQAQVRRYWWLPAALGLLALAGLAYTLRVEVLVKRRTAELTRSLAERDRLARQLEHDREALDHLSRLSILGELAATLGHELNQPLATIANYAASIRRRVARDALKPDALAQALDDIEGEAERAAQVLQGIRSLAGKRAPRREPLLAGALVAEAVAMFSGLQPRAPRVDVQAPPAAAGLAVNGDARQLHQVLLNLLKNAWDAHRAAGTADRAITVEVAPHPPGQLRLSVLDRGPPLAAADAARLFEPFFTTKADGLGLGLPICKRIVEAHGGTLRARPAGHADVAGGLAFDLLLPLAGPLPAEGGVDAAAAGADAAIGAVDAGGDHRAPGTDGHGIPVAHRFGAR